MTEPVRSTRAAASSVTAPWTLLAVAATVFGCAPGDGGEGGTETAPTRAECRAESGFVLAEGPELRHATGFSLSYEDGYKVITTHPPTDRGGGRDVVVVVACGRDVPPLEGSLSDAHVVQLPVRTAAANEDLSLTRLRVLGLTDRVVGVGSRGIYDDGLRGRFESGAAVEIGASFHGPPRFETLLTARPDLTFLSTASLSEATSLQRARSLGLAAVPSVSWVEPTLMGQAEWLYFVAALLDEEETARAILADVESRYIDLSERARSTTRRPLVLWVDPSGAGDRWVVPSNSWKARAIEDAGGRVAFAEGRGAVTREITSEEILEIGDSIFAVITESIALNEPGSAGALERLPAVAEGRLYSVHRRALARYDAYDWYESAVVEVDRVLEDFVALLHPELMPGHIDHHLIPARSARSGRGAGEP